MIYRVSVNFLTLLKKVLPSNIADNHRFGEILSTVGVLGSMVLCTIRERRVSFYGKAIAFKACKNPQYLCMAY